VAGGSATVAGRALLLLLALRQGWRRGVRVRAYSYYSRDVAASVATRARRNGGRGVRLLSTHTVPRQHRTASDSSPTSARRGAARRYCDRRAASLRFLFREKGGDGTDRRTSSLDDGHATHAVRVIVHHFDGVLVRLNNKQPLGLVVRTWMTDARCDSSFEKRSSAPGLGGSKRRLPVSISYLASSRATRRARVASRHVTSRDETWRADT
jgi:hypothetical protein